MTDRRDMTMVTGSLWPMDIPVSQTWREIGASLFELQALRIRRYVEIGVHRGGLASLLIARTIVTELEYRGIEIDSDIIDLRLAWLLDRAPRAQVTIGDVFSDFGQTWLDAQFKDEGPLLILCDGGDKPREVAIVVPRLRSGDYLLVHDWLIEIGEGDIPAGLRRLTPDWMDGCNLALFTRTW